MEKVIFNNGIGEILTIDGNGNYHFECIPGDGCFTIKLTEGTRPVVSVYDHDTEETEENEATGVDIHTAKSIFMRYIDKIGDEQKKQIWGKLMTTFTESVESRIKALVEYAKANSQIFVFSDEIFTPEEAEDAMLDNYLGDMESNELTEDEFIEKMKTCMFDKQEA